MNSTVDQPSERPTLKVTGRYIVIFKQDAVAGPTEAKDSLRKTLGRVSNLGNLVTSSDFDRKAFSAEVLKSEQPLYFESLGVARVSSDMIDALSASTAESDSPILQIESEYVAYPASQPVSPASLEYLRGYRDAANHLYEQLSSGEMAFAGDAANGQPSANFQDTAQFTWGLQAIGVSTSRYSGQGIRLAVLDTGMDLGHPDFVGRRIIAESFSGYPVQDVHGHGTHCVGIACGPQRPATGVRRYGVAPGAQILVGKVFDESALPEAPTSNVLAGIEWAVASGCRVISISIEVPGDHKMVQYEVPIQRALNAGALIVCAAGNNANRPSDVGYVAAPANADAAMAVAALDNQLRIANFSGRSSSITGVGGRINVAAPGVAVFSSYPRAMGTHRFMNGTSMAAPHVAGIAALLAQATGEPGVALWNRIQRGAAALNLRLLDVGTGLAQGPQ
jgi:subtilisin family serine protease